MQSVTNTEIAIKADETMTFTRNNKYKCRNKQSGGNNQTSTKS